MLSYFKRSRKKIVILLSIAMSSLIVSVNIAESKEYSLRSLIDQNQNETEISENNMINEHKMLYAGYFHSAALKSDGSVWSWGDNAAGQLGDGTLTSRTSPVQVLGANENENYLTDIIEISGGFVHTVALKSDGSVWSWGYNGNGQLGDGTTINRLKPVQVLGPNGEGYLSDIIHISGGYYHTVALKSDGTVWSWGNNYYGDLGSGNTYDRPFPVQVIGPNGEGFLTDVVAISNRSAVRSDGTVWSWGYNRYGQLGDGSKIDRSTPVQVIDSSGEGFLNNLGAISNGYMHTLALKKDGSVVAWGENPLGDGTSISSSIPRQVRDSTNEDYFSGVIDISAGFIFSYVLKSNGTVWSWGQNHYGQLGNGEAPTRTLPVQVKAQNGDFLSHVEAIAAGDSHGLALKSDGTLWSWGNNESGQLGIGSNLSSQLPVQVDSYNFNVIEELEVIQSSPENDNIEAVINSDIEVLFSTDIQMGTEFQSISLKTEEAVILSNVRIEGAKLIIEPQENLDYSESYELVVPMKAVKGILGEQLNSNYILNFTTISNNKPVATVSYPSPDQSIYNSFKFKWSYYSPNNNPQSSYQIQGSINNWETIDFDTDIVSSQLYEHLVQSLGLGEWDFRLRVNDGLQWSDWNIIQNVIITRTKNQKISYQYDEQNRLVSVTYESGLKIVYTYDAAGNVTIIQSIQLP